MSAGPRLAQRLLWFIGLWTAGVISIGAVAWLLRTWIGAG